MNKHHVAILYGLAIAGIVYGVDSRWEPGDEHTNVGLILHAALIGLIATGSVFSMVLTLIGAVLIAFTSLVTFGPASTLQIFETSRISSEEYFRTMSNLVPLVIPFCAQTIVRMTSKKQDASA